MGQRARSDFSEKPPTWAVELRLRRLDWLEVNCCWEDLSDTNYLMPKAIALLFLVRQLTRFELGHAPNNAALSHVIWRRAFARLFLMFSDKCRLSHRKLCLRTQRQHNPDTTINQNR
jgi:hypothetical protein